MQAGRQPPPVNGKAAEPVNVDFTFCHAPTACAVHRHSLIFLIICPDNSLGLQHCRGRRAVEALVGYLAQELPFSSGGSWQRAVLSVSMEGPMRSSAYF